MRGRGLAGGTLDRPRFDACSACPGDYEDPDRTAGNSREAADAAEVDEEFEADEEEFSE